MWFVQEKQIVQCQFIHFSLIRSSGTIILWFLPQYFAFVLNFTVPLLFIEVSGGVRYATGDGIGGYVGSDEGLVLVDFVAHLLQNGLDGRIVIVVHLDLHMLLVVDHLVLALLDQDTLQHDFEIPVGQTQ